MSFVSARVVVSVVCFCSSWWNFCFRLHDDATMIHVQCRGEGVGALYEIVSVSEQEI